jgi:hypothetical protein
MLRAWKRQLSERAGAMPGDVFAGQARLPGDQEELRRLKRDVARLAQENALLQSSATYVAADERLRVQVRACMRNADVAPARRGCIGSSRPPQSRWRSSGSSGACRETSVMCVSHDRSLCCAPRAPRRLADLEADRRRNQSRDGHHLRMPASPVRRRDRVGHEHARDAGSRHAVARAVEQQSVCRGDDELRGRAGGRERAGTLRVEIMSSMMRHGRPRTSPTTCVTTVLLPLSRSLCNTTRGLPSRRAYSLAIRTRPESGETTTVFSLSSPASARHNSGTAVSESTGPRKNPSVCSA